MCKYLFFLVILVFSGCQKQPQFVNNESSSQEDIVYHIDSPQENDKNPDVVFIPYEGNFTLEDILGSWWMGTPWGTNIMEFTNDGILHISKFDNNFVFATGSFYPYKIEKNSIVIEDINKDNNLDSYFTSVLLSPGSYITTLDDRKLFIENLSKNSLLFYKGTVEQLIERRDTRKYFENKLKEFIHDEFLNGIIFQGDINDENGVINTYGIPIKDEIIEYSDDRGGGLRLVGIREITYEDLTHRYYVFTIGVQYYVDVIINRKLERLTIINIGATSEEVLELFGSNYWHKEGEDIIYIWGGDGEEDYRWVRFSIENNIVNKISYIITSWG